MRLRPFDPADLPAVLALRQRVFARTAQSSDEAAGRYWRTVLLENPWQPVRVPSLVCEDEGGRVLGFLGILARPMRWRGRDIVSATPTQLMAEPASAAIVGIRLLREFLAGPHDLAFADAANDAARRIWEFLGGWTGHLSSLTWSRPLRAARYGMQAWGSHPLARAFRLGLSPAAAVADAVTSGAFIMPKGYSSGPLAPRDVVAAFDAATTKVGLTPRYDEASFAWLLQRVAERAGPGETRAELVVHAGSPAGWYVWQARGSRAEVVQLAGAPPHRLAVLQSLLHDVAKAGFTVVNGRYDPLFAEALAAESCVMARSGAWTLIHARDPEIGRAALGGDAFLSRLEGEWYMNF